MYLYHAKIADPQLLEKMLFGRRETADWLEKIALTFAETGHATHSLLIGNRGMGKSHLISVLYHRLSRSEMVKKNLVIAYLEEDPYGIADYLDLLRRIIRAIARLEQNPDQKKALLAAHQVLIATEPSRRIAVAEAILLEHLAGRRMLLLVENLNDIFNALGEVGQSRWRDFLQSQDNTMICATSQAIFTDVQSRERPFFGFFHVSYLEKLRFQEAHDLLIALAEEKNNQDLIAYLKTPEGAGKLRAIFELTEGNHRLLVTFYDFFMSEFRAELSRSFLQTVDQMKPYYESFLKLLPPQQQKIVQFLVVERIPQAGKVIGDNCFLPSTTVSKQMSELQRLGYVRNTRLGRDAYYEITEPMLRMCLESNENTDGILSIFVDFLGSLYSSKDLKVNYLRLKLREQNADEALFTKISDEVYFYEKALSQYAKGWEPLTLGLVELHGLSEPEQDLEIRRLVENSEAEMGDLEKIVELIIGNRFEETEAMLEKIFPEHLSAVYWFFIGALRDCQNRLVEAEAAYRKVLEIIPGNLIVLKKLIVILAKQQGFPSMKGGLQQYIENCPESVDELYHYFHLYAIMQDAEKASLVFERYCDTDKDVFLMVNLYRLCICADKSTMYSVLVHKRFQDFIKNNKELSFPTALQIVTRLLLQRNVLNSKKLHDFHEVLTSLYGKKKSFIYPLKFLSVGIRYVKENDPAALLELTLEERRVFEREILGKDEGEV